MPPIARIGWTFLLLGLTVQALVGFSIALALDTPLWSWHQDRVGISLWGEAEYAKETRRYRAWAMAVIGGTIASWAVALLWVVAVPLRGGERWAWWAVATSTLAWFSIDTSLSALHGIGINVLFNLGALAMIGLPLAMTWSWANAGISPPGPARGGDGRGGSARS